MRNFNIPNIKESLKIDYLAGNISIEQCAKELHEANLLPYVDIDLTKKLLSIK